MSGSKWPREYERVTSIEDVDPNDFVALTKARQQWVRDRYGHVLLVPGTNREESASTRIVTLRIEI